MRVTFRKMLTYRNKLSPLKDTSGCSTNKTTRWNQKLTNLSERMMSLLISLNAGLSRPPRSKRNTTCTKRKPPKGRQKLNHNNIFEFEWLMKWKSKKNRRCKLKKERWLFLLPTSTQLPNDKIKRKGSKRVYSEHITMATPLVKNWNLSRSYQGYHCWRVTGCSRSSKAKLTDRIHIKVLEIATTRLRIPLFQLQPHRRIKRSRQLERAWVAWSASTVAANISRYIRPYVTSPPRQSRTNTNVRSGRKLKEIKSTGTTKAIAMSKMWPNSTTMVLILRVTEGEAILTVNNKILVLKSLSRIMKTMIAAINTANNNHTQIVGKADFRNETASWKQKKS